MAYLHDEGVVYSVLRAENVLFNIDTGRALLANIGITDSCSGATLIGQETRFQGDTRLRWKSPELVDPTDHSLFYPLRLNSTPSPSSDMYAFACTCVEVCCVLWPDIHSNLSLRHCCDNSSTQDVYTLRFPQVSWLATGLPTCRVLMGST